MKDDKIKSKAERMKGAKNWTEEEENGEILDYKRLAGNSQCTPLPTVFSEDFMKYLYSVWWLDLNFAQDTPANY
jgi:hypothetical protein